jgi:hypothetical protein
VPLTKTPLLRPHAKQPECSVSGPSSRQGSTINSYPMSQNTAQSKARVSASGTGVGATEKAASICYIDLTATERMKSTPGSTQFNRHRMFYNTKRENGYGLPSKHVLLQKESLSEAAKMYAEVFDKWEDMPAALRECHLLRAFLTGIRVRFQNCSVVKSLARHCPMVSSKLKQRASAVDYVALRSSVVKGNIAAKKKINQRAEVVEKQVSDSTQAVYNAAYCRHRGKSIALDSIRSDTAPLDNDRENRKYVLNLGAVPISNQNIMNEQVLEESEYDSECDDKNTVSKENEKPYKKTKRGCRGGKRKQGVKSFFDFLARKRSRPSGFCSDDVEVVSSHPPTSAGSADHARVVTFAEYEGEDRKGRREGQGEGEDKREGKVAAFASNVRHDSGNHHEDSVIDDTAQEASSKNIPSYHSFRLQNATPRTTGTHSQSESTSQPCSRTSDSAKAAAPPSTSPLNRTDSQPSLGTVGDRLIARMRSNVAKDITLRTKKSRSVTTQSVSTSPSSRGYVSQEDTVCKSVKRSTRSATKGLKHTILPALQDTDHRACSGVTRGNGNTINKFQYDVASRGSEENDDSREEKMLLSDKSSSKYLSSARAATESAVHSSHSQDERQGQRQGQGQSQGQGQTQLSGGTIHSQSDGNTEITESVCTVMWLQGMDAATGSKAMKSGLALHVNYRTYSTQVRTSDATSMP